MAKGDKHGEGPGTGTACMGAQSSQVRWRAGERDGGLEAGGVLDNRGLTLSTFAWRRLPRKVTWPEVPFRKVSARRRIQWGGRGQARPGKVTG